jgi:hypothetical protein
MNNLIINSKWKNGIQYLIIISIPVFQHSNIEYTPKSNILATKALRHQDAQNVNY